MNHTGPNAFTSRKVEASFLIALLVAGCGGGGGDPAGSSLAEVDPVNVAPTDNPADASSGSMDLVEQALNRGSRGPRGNQNGGGGSTPAPTPAPAPAPGTTPAPTPGPAPTPTPTPSPAPTPTPSPSPAPTGALVPVTSAGYSVTDAQFARLYGPGVYAQDELGNSVVGIRSGTERIVSNRFRAPVAGNLASVRLYWQTGSGYSLGNGGTIRIRVLPDDGTDAHLPNMNAAPLASGTYRPGVTGGARPIFETVSLQSQSPLVRGQLYHVVYDNVDAAPAANYISTNNALTIANNGRPTRWLSYVDWATLTATRPGGSSQAYSWRDLNRNGASNEYYMPILQLNLDDGRIFGNVNMEGGAQDPDTVFHASSSAPIRERFTPTSDKRISGVSFSTAATAAGALKWEIVHGSVVLASGTVSEGTANYRTHTATNNLQIGQFAWYDIALPTTVDFAAGNAYDLVLTPQGSSRWKFPDQRNGKDYGFAWPAAYTESQAQHYYGGRWINAYHWNYSTTSSAGSNWRVVLHLAP